MKKILKISSVFVLALIANVALAQSAAYFNVNLSVGSTQKTEVVKLQNFLISQGFLGTQYNTGVFGTLTKNAVSSFQTANNVSPASGNFGPLTRAVANAIYSGSSGESTLPASVNIESVTDESLAGAVALAGTKTVKWKTTNYPADAGVNINLLKKVSDSPLSFDLVRNLATDAKNTSSFTWTPKSTDTGEIYVEVTCSSTYKFKGGCNFSSGPVKVK